MKRSILYVVTLLVMTLSACASPTAVPTEAPPAATSTAVPPTLTQTAIPPTATITPTSTPKPPPTLVSVLGNKEVLLTVRNQSAEVLKFIWVDYDGKEVSYGDIPANGSVEQNTFFTHPWILRNADGQIVTVYVATDADKQTLTVSADTVKAAHQAALTDYPYLRSLNSDKAIALTFVNNSTVPLNIFWVNFDGREEVIPGAETVAAGGSTGVSSFFTHPWRLRNSAGKIVYEYIATDADEQTVTITDETLKLSQER